MRGPACPVRPPEARTPVTEGRTPANCMVPFTVPVPIVPEVTPWRVTPTGNHATIAFAMALHRRPKVWPPGKSAEFLSAVVRVVGGIMLICG